MRTVRPRILVGAALMASMGMTFAATPAAAACGLTGPDSVQVGTVLSVYGAGFPANASVDVTIAIDGEPSDSFTTQSGQAGAIEISMTPEASEAGLTTISVTAGPGCATEVVVEVLAPGQTARPRTTTQPAGDTAAGGSGSGAPPTDGAAAGNTPDQGQLATSILPWVIVGAGVLGLIKTSPGRARRRTRP
jgi:hypothetical protein